MRNAHENKGWYFLCENGNSLILVQWRHRLLSLDFSPLFLSYESLIVNSAPFYQTHGWGLLKLRKGNRHPASRCNFSCFVALLDSFTLEKRRIYKFFIIFVIFCTMDYILKKCFEKALPPLPLWRKRHWLRLYKP